MCKRKTLRRALLILLLAVTVVVGFARYNQHKAQLRNRDRVRFVLNIAELPDSLEVEDSWIDNSMEYHIVIACRDKTRKLDYLLKGRDWESIAIAPRSLNSSFSDNRHMEHTIVREASWHEDKAITAAVHFDADGERFIVEYHAL